MIQLSQEERDRFAAWLEHDAQSDRSLIPQLSALPGAMSEMANVKLRDAEAKERIAKQLRATESSEIAAAPAKGDSDVEETPEADRGRADDGCAAVTATVEEEAVTPRGPQPADTDALIERLHNLLIKELDGEGIDDLNRLADVLAREREEATRLNRMADRLVIATEVSEERAERAEAQVEALAEIARAILADPENTGRGPLVITRGLLDRLGEALASLPPPQEEQPSP